MAIDDQQLSEINENRQQKAQTVRATVEAMEDLLYKPIKVLIMVLLESLIIWETMLLLLKQLVALMARELNLLMMMKI